MFDPDNNEGDSSSSDQSIVLYCGNQDSKINEPD